MPRRSLAAAVTAVAVSLTLTACGSSEEGAASSDDTIRVAYQKTTAFYQADDLMKKVKSEFEAANEGRTVELVPIEAEQDQYFTKLALMNGSASTAPDVIYEDTFQVRSDAAAGFLLPIDEYVNEWEDWDQFFDTAKEAGLGDDGKVYGVPMGTDTRGIYYNKEIFQQAGLPADWQPKNWDELLEAARTVKEKVPGVIPINVYSGKAAGEATSMQGFEMLLYGTKDTLYDEEAGKWVTGSQGFVDSLEFLRTIHKEELAPPLDITLDAAITTRVSTELIPQGKLAIAVDGSWQPGTWMGGDNAWPEWEQTMGMAAMPTQDGGEPGFTSMSGGWVLSVGANSANPDAAFQFISTALNKENSLKFDTKTSQVAVREDVANDPKYLGYNPSFEFFSSLVQYTHFRPATPEYPQISSNIQVAAEAMATGQQTPEEATATYEEALISIVGEDKVQDAR